MDTKNVDDDDETDSLDSNDEALCELLGISSLTLATDQDEITFRSLQDLSNIEDSDLVQIARRYKLSEQYEATSIFHFPEELRIPSEIMRRLSDEAVWVDNDKIDRSYENISVWKDGAVFQRKTLTRLENLNSHTGWFDLCNNFIRRCLSAALGIEMVLFKSKLNLKPPGGTGFSPHVDTPSLQVPLGDAGPQTFITVMVAIDDMTERNGCLRIAKGRWADAAESCPTIAPHADASPDAGGRAGAIPQQNAEQMDFADVCIDGGSMIAFHGWVPHRSGPNRSNFSRRAVFLTYNPASQGDCHDLYYSSMNELRHDWNANNSAGSNAMVEVAPSELQALSTIPKI